MTTEQSLPILDDQMLIQSVDKRSMIRIVDELPEQCETAMNIGRNFIPPVFDIPVDGVYLIGSGDNAMACEMAAHILAEYVSVPVSIGNIESLPRYVGASTLVVIVDYNGKNPRVLRIYDELQARGVKAVCVTSGGKLSEKASSGGSKVFKVPPGQPARSALGYLVIPIVAVVSSCGLAQGAMEKMGSAILLLKNAREEFRFSRSSARNMAKKCAEGLHDKKIYVMGSGEALGLVARRWKSQFNQNSKIPACCANMTDEISGQISAWENIENTDEWGVVLLKADKELAENTLAYNAVVDVLGSFPILQMTIKGKTVAEKIFYGCYFADYVSCYLAVLNGINPSITEYATAVQESIIQMSEQEEPAEI